MKRLSVMMALVMLTGPSLADVEHGVTRLSEPVAIEADAEIFGSLMDETLPRKRLQELVSAPAEWVGKPVRLQARVSEVCQKKGCFFIAKDGATSLRVSFVDYSFFVPTDIGDKTVEFVGELVEVNRSAAEAEHLSDDAGTEFARGPAFEIVATSVRVPTP